MLNEKVLNMLLEEVDKEKNEVFNLKYNTHSNRKEILGDYRINENGLEVCIPRDDQYWRPSEKLNDMLRGRISVVKLSFVPEVGEHYYMADITSSSLYSAVTNLNTIDDTHIIKHKLAYKNKKGAVKKAKEILESMEGSEG